MAPAGAAGTAGTGIEACGHHGSTEAADRPSFGAPRLQMPRNSARRGRPSAGAYPHRPSATVRYIAPMIVRVLTATVANRQSPRLHELMRQQLPLLREHEGLVYVKLARRLVGREEEVVLFEEWRDPASMYAWTGPNIERPRLLPGAEDLITDLKITHYEALDVDPPA